MSTLLVREETWTSCKWEPWCSKCHGSACHALLRQLSAPPAACQSTSKPSRLARHRPITAPPAKLFYTRPCAPHLEFSLLLPHSTTLPPCFHNTLCNLSPLYRLTMASIVEKQLQSLLDGFDALRLEYQRVYSRCAVLEAQMVTAKSQVSLSHTPLLHLTPPPM